MAPLRRYLRISKYSVVECRIYLENPSDSRWLIDSRDPGLPRVFAAIKHLVVPKLREERERLRAKKKSKPVKDVITGDDFEVAIFLRERDQQSRHAILTRQKLFHGASTKTDALPTIERNEPSVLIESDSEPDVGLQDIPEVSADAGEDGGTDSSDEESRPKRRKIAPEEAQTDDKKLGFNTKYDGFSVYGFVLCLLVARKGERAAAVTASTSRPGTPAASDTTRQALMEEWISTQAPGVLDDD